MSHKVFISFKCSTINAFFTILLSNAKIFLNLIQGKFFRPIMKADFQLVMYERVQFCCSANLTKNSKKIFSLVDYRLMLCPSLPEMQKKGNLMNTFVLFVSPFVLIFGRRGATYRRFAQTLGILMLVLCIFTHIFVLNLPRQNVRSC